MTERIKTLWRTYNFEAILLVLGLGLLVALICFTDPDWLSPGDTIQTMALVILVIVTVSYARSTRKIYEVALNSERNGVFPIISITLNSTIRNQIHITYQNSGRGPALNLKIWLSAEYDKQFCYLKSDAMKNRDFVAAVGAGQGGSRRWNSKDGPLPSPTSGLDIVAEYTDVFRQDSESRLEIVNTFDHEFKFEKR